ncbi:MAG: 30S ribosomal protein S4 [Candidatus Altiarchaeales archaeon HGW-Altiarchaeales-1]|nr:MAG: 30S ribosomal protein S4 [Candidatus Altiarchaeales archaeon HGW-Altiarchaeales-1]
MGIKRFDKKYSTPRHLWRGERISSETEVMNRYGLKNHKEIWKVLFKLSRWRELARHLIINKDLKGTDELLNPIMNISCLKEKKLESVFEISPNDMLERRLQTVVFRKGLAQTIKQARHFITHKHILIDDKVVNVPGYIVHNDDEGKITCDLIVDTKTDKKVKETSANEKAYPAPLYRKRPERRGPNRKHIKKVDFRKQFNNSGKKQKNADADTKKK